MSPSCFPLKSVAAQTFCRVHLVKTMFLTFCIFNYSKTCVSFKHMLQKIVCFFSVPSCAAEIMEKLRCRQQLAISLLFGLWFPCFVTQSTPSNTATPSPSPVPQTQTERPRVRLAGHPRKHNEGRIELFYKGEWGTICDDDFSIGNANVLCRQLGFVSATGWTHSAKYGKGQGKGHLNHS